jgi:hypothetical protein
MRIQGMAAGSSPARTAPTATSGAAPGGFADRLPAAPGRSSQEGGERRRAAGGEGRSRGTGRGGEGEGARFAPEPAARPAPATEGLPGGGPGAAGESRSRAAGTPLLARAIERLAIAVDLRGGPALTVRLGASLEVTLTQRPSGVEVRLAAARGLSPAAEAELPLLVAALRARGVRVVRADVRRIAAGARRPAGEDVDRGEALR